MFNFHKNLKNLILTAFSGFAILSTVIAIVPAYQMQHTEPLPGQPVFSKGIQKGLEVYISEGCVACHTQQVRSIEMDNIWGDRPSLPSDYFYSKQRMDFWRQSPSLLGSERTGPDLTDIGNRQPSMEWHLLHLYNPRLVVYESVMPGYPWLFEEKNVTDVTEDDVVVPIPAELIGFTEMRVVAGKKALRLVDYLLATKQVSLAKGSKAEFIPSKQDKQESKPKNSAESANQELPNGEKLYMQTCAVCHKQDGSGLRGAFPPLAGSDVVNDEDPDFMIRIILQGYDARSEYGQMPSFASQLTDAEIAAIVNHERSSWGNNASSVTADLVKEIREFVNQNL